MEITWDDFQKVDLRVGTIVDVQEFPEAQKPAFKLKIDLGPLGVKRSSAQVTTLYHMDDLLNRQVLCVCNFSPKQIGPYVSEVLVTGFVLANQSVVLVSPDQPIPNGSRLG